SDLDAPLDPPTPRTDVLAFRARSAAAGLFTEVRRRSLACTQVTIRLTATNGQRSERTWRLEDMDDNRVADRVRWQAAGWLTSLTAAAPGRAPDEGPDEGIALLTLIAAELAAPLDTQRSLLDR